MRTMMTLALLLIGSAAHAQYPYQYAYPYRMDWYNRQWALRNEQEFVRRMPDFNTYRPYYPPASSGNRGYDTYERFMDRYERRVQEDKQRRSSGRMGYGW